ncbi:MAG: c-type cytochrome [Burkholderiaceae bacterium]
MKSWQHIAAIAALALLGAVAVPVFAQAKKAATGTSTPSAAHVGSGGSSPAAANAPYPARFRETCAACHGADGRSDIAGTPVLAGQHSLYAITQLYLFREGRRDNAAMVAMAKPMTDADLRGFSEYIGTLAPVPGPASAAPIDAERMTKGQALAKQYKCVFCHGAVLDGGQGVPRIGGQKEDYLSMVLHGFKSGERAGYTRAMSEALSQVPVEDLDVLAYYVANFGTK